MSAPPGSGRSGEPTDPAAAGAGAGDDAGLQRATERALADLLTAHGWHDPVVAITGAASVGAQRSTLLIDIESEDEIIPAVAQLSSGIIAAVPATDSVFISQGAAATMARPRPCAAALALPLSHRPRSSSLTMPATSP